MKYDTPTLPLDLEVLDAHVLHTGLSPYEELYIKYNAAMKHYYLESRVFSMYVDWIYHYKVTLAQARQIVANGDAGWWVTVPEEFR